MTEQMEIAKQIMIDILVEDKSSSFLQHRILKFLDDINQFEVSQPDPTDYPIDWSERN